MPSHSIYVKNAVNLFFLVPALSACTPDDTDQQLVLIDTHTARAFNVVVSPVAAFPAAPHVRLASYESTPALESSTLQQEWADSRLEQPADRVFEPAKYAPYEVRAPDAHALTMTAEIRDACEASESPCDKTA